MNFQTARRLGSYRRTLGITAVMLTVALYAAIVLATGTTADVVLGQLNFTSNGIGLGGDQGLYQPFGVAIDTSVAPNRVYVVDTYNSRVLGWKDAATLTNGEAADLVIGQPDFTSHAANNGGISASSLSDPLGAAVDGSGNLYVADYTNSRVLEYTNPFAACEGAFPCVGGPANLVFGQGNFTSGTCNNDSATPSANSLCEPAGVAVDGLGNLYVADSENNRVLEYTAALTPNLTANEVFGQGSSFTSAACNNGGVSAASLCDPYGVAVDGSDNLYVADFANDRVLEYNTPLTNTTANQVFGQGGSFTSNTQNNGGVSANSLYNPTGVAVDGSGHLYVVDDLNDRVLEYNTPLTTGGATATQVFGQGGSFTTEGCNDGGLAVTATTLCNPFGVAVDGSGHLYVADQGNNRVLEYEQPLAVPSPTATASPTATSTRTATATATATATPTTTPTPVVGKLKVSPKALNFGNVDVGASKTKSVKITNAGKVTTKKKKITTPPPILIEMESGVTSPFSITQACNDDDLGPKSKGVPPGSCEVSVKFMPTTAIKYKGTLTIEDNLEPSFGQNVKLEGTGKVPKNKQ